MNTTAHQRSIAIAAAALISAVPMQSPSYHVTARYLLTGDEGWE